MTNATVYMDVTSDPKNPGWVCETSEDGRPQFAMDANADATNADLIAEAARFADGQITVRR